jgi:hypothetical protein
MQPKFTFLSKSGCDEGTWSCRYLLLDVRMHLWHPGPHTNILKQQLYWLVRKSNTICWVMRIAVEGKNVDL